MVMEFDQYLQPCDVTDSRCLAVYDQVSKSPPIIDVRRAAAAAAAAAETITQSTGSPLSSTEDRPTSSSDDEDVEGDASPKVNRCKWDCIFDNEDAETILTSETVSFNLISVQPCHNTRSSSKFTLAHPPTWSSLKIRNFLRFFTRTLFGMLYLLSMESTHC